MQPTPRAPWIFSLLLIACQSAPAPLTVIATSEHAPLLDAAMEFVALPGWIKEVSANPEDAVARRSGLRIALVEDSSCAECFTLERKADQVVIRGGAPLGLQYGLYALLEETGYRFHHPWRAHEPSTVALPTTSPAFDVRQAPEIARRGLHLHTLHPIEAMFDFLVPSEKHLEGARRTIDFVVKNRGNFVEWYVLSDSASDPAWKEHTRKILAYAHQRGVKVGLSAQLFGKASLQKSFVLFDVDPPADPKPLLRERLKLLLEGLPVDRLNLTFGEFFGADPEVFVSTINEVSAVLLEVAPAAEMTTTVHVGNYDGLRVTYRGEPLFYYFLVKHADPRIVPLVHTVMFYNLVDSAGGAYLHPDFAEHRAFLFERMRAGKKVGYYPESAYWVCFDNSVPLYMRSRYVDLKRIADEAAAGGFPGLSEHNLFSSGWEWGYWQTDVATLRMNWALPKKWSDPLAFAFAPWGEKGAKAVEQLTLLGEAQHRGLIEQQLAPYLAGTDQLISVGESRGLVSVPLRPSFEKIAAFTAVERAAFDTNVLTPLAELSQKTDAVEAAINALALDAEDPFLAEMIESVQVTALRTRFVLQLFRTARNFGADGTDDGGIAKAEALLVTAKAAIASRHRKMLHPDPKSLVNEAPNPTLYQYGYLREAASACYWRRELAEVRNLVRKLGEAVPGCVL
jgi:hypothetical protein